MRTFLATLAILTALATPAWALDLAGTKAQGLIGETAKGYVAIVTPPGTPELQELVKSTNAGRAKIYGDNAAKQHVAIEQVEAVAGATLIEKTPSGQYVQDANGHWQKK